MEAEHLKESQVTKFEIEVEHWKKGLWIKLEMEVEHLKKSQVTKLEMEVEHWKKGLGTKL